MKLLSVSTFQFAFCVSVVAHGVLVSIRIIDPERVNRMLQDTPLEVILVNARTSESALKAQALAQAAMAGGGEAQRARATSPLPPALLSDDGEQVDARAQAQLHRLQERQNLLLAQVKSRLASISVPDPNPSDPLTPDPLQREQARRQLSKLLAEIERRIRAQNDRPRKRYISPATKEAVHAIYYDHLRRRIENKGTENFPEAGGKKLYGELTLAVTVNADGQVHQIEIIESSGNRQLDARAQAIVQSAAPFGRFNASMRRQSEQIWVVSRFRFTHDETLETLSGSQ